MENDTKAEILFDVTDMDTRPGRVVRAGAALTPARAPVPAGQVSETGKARSETDEAAARAAGFSPAPPVYAIGTRVIAVGEQNYRQSRMEYDAMPSAPLALGMLAHQVEGEMRRDEPVLATEVRMDPADGALIRTVPGGITRNLLADRAFKSLCSLVTPGGATYLERCPVHLRAENLNHWLANSEANRALNLRTRVPQFGAREVFAVTGPRYQPFDVNLIAREVQEALHGMEARADVVYDGYRVRINVLFHSNVPATDLVAGEFFKAGLLIRTADDGTGSIKVDAQVWRNLCLNLIIIDQARQSTLRRRHAGMGIRDSVRLGVQQAMESITHFTEAWGYARTSRPVEEGYASAETIFRALIRTEQVQAPGGEDVLVDRLLQAWSAEPGSNRADIINAITRAAHTTGWSSPWVTEELERQAGVLLFAKDWGLAPAIARIAAE